MITVSQGDYGYVITDTLLNADNSAFDLTGYAVKLHTWQPSKPGTLLVNSNAVITSNTNGTVSYTVANTDFIYKGIVYAEWEATKANVRQSFPTNGFQIEVKESG
jgi:hypothetical protein